LFFQIWKASSINHFYYYYYYFYMSTPEKGVRFKLVISALWDVVHSRLNYLLRQIYLFLFFLYILTKDLVTCQNKSGAMDEDPVPCSTIKDSIICSALAIIHGGLFLCLRANILWTMLKKIFKPCLLFHL
jgi:hypothetical protein